MNRILALPFALALTVPAVLVTTAPGQERVGTSQADLPSYRGAFSIDNQTGVTLHYQVKWGEKNAWKSIDLPTGRTETHSHPLENGRAPTPYVRFDKVAGDNRFTEQEYRMEFYRVGYAGYGARTNPTQPKKYVFRFSPDGKRLDINAL